MDYLSNVCQRSAFSILQKGGMDLRYLSCFQLEQTLEIVMSL